MSETPILKQKQAGLILIILGALLFLFIILFLYFRSVRIPGFAEILPAKETAAFFEFPLSLDDVFVKKINEAFKVDAGKDIASWGGGRGAAAFLTSPDSEKLLPLLLLEVSDQPNNIGTATAQLISNILVIAPSSAILQNFLSYQSAEYQHLSTDRTFMKVRQNVFGPFFGYLKPQKIPAAAWDFFSKWFSNAPEISFSFETVGIGAKKENDKWTGNSYALGQRRFVAQSGAVRARIAVRADEEPYRAALLPFLHPEFEWLLAGQNFARAFQQIDPKIAREALAKYLQGVNFEKELAPHLASEFALAYEDGKVLFVTALKNGEADFITKIRGRFGESAKHLVQKTRDVTLPDGVKAKEFIPDPAAVKSFEEEFRGIAMQGFIFGKQGALFDAVVAGKWFVSNDLTVLKKSLLLTVEEGRNFRESDAYKTFLQPILKNPELLGVARSDGMTFSFSKRTFEDHMETGFVLR